MNNGWEGLLQFVFLFVLMGAALLVKNSFKLFRKHLIPLSILAGLMGLVLGPDILKLIPFDRDLLTKAVYHMLALGFISLGLKERMNKKSEDIINTGFFTVTTYAVQGIVGLAVSLALAALFYPDLFKSMGMLLPLGFAQGPGQAVSIGLQWEEIGFADGGNVGLSVATIGFLWALIGGVPFMNFLVRKNRKVRMREVRPDLDNVDGLSPDTEEHTIKIKKSVYMDELAIQFVLIGVTYALTYAFMLGLSALLEPLGTFGNTLSGLLWGFNFLWGAIFAMGIRKLLDALRKKNIVRQHYADNFMLQRISSTLFDLMITASISAVSIAVLGRYLGPVLVLTTVGGVFMIFYSYYMSRWVYKKDTIEHMVTIYGTWTGTITTGMALLKELDPDGRTHVPENIVIGSGIAAAAGIILMMILNLATMAEVTGNGIYYIWTFIALALYSLAMVAGIILVKRKYRRKPE
ncbi:MAG: sodium:glutamate symporter [Clostridia bacterium]|nr:sodium:glutamate symporter [Clostridia bacterium]